jgi:flagellar motor switch/type III secretory pathway protein FliN
MSIGVQVPDTKPAEIEDISGLTRHPDPLDSMPWLPCSLTLEVPVPGFTLADLLMLTEGSIIATACHQTSDVPLRVNQLLIGWTEFEVIDDQLAVRITDQV